MAKAQSISKQAGGTTSGADNGGNKQTLDGTINRGKFDPEEYRKNYKVMHIGVGTKHRREYDAVTALAKRWGLTESQVVWAAIEAYLATPNLQKPSSESAAVGGSAAGYWTVPIVGADGKATDVEVIHVDKRADLPVGKKGHTFFRYDREDPKSQERAKRQAERAAMFFRKILLGDQAAQVSQQK